MFPFKSQEKKDSLDLNYLRTAVSHVRETLEEIFELNFSEQEKSSAGHMILNACEQLLNMFPNLYENSAVLFDAKKNISAVYQNLDPNDSVEAIQNALMKLHDTCLWFDLTYNLGVYSTFRHRLPGTGELMDASFFEQRSASPKPNFVRIRPLTHKDLKIVKEIEETYFDYPSSLDHICKFHNLAAELNGDFAGYALYSLNNSFDSTPHTLSIDTIAVHPDKLGRGVGSWLLKSLVIEAQNHNASEMHALVRESNRAAIDFFQACGYWEAGKYRYENTKEKGLKLVKQVPIEIW